MADYWESDGDNDALRVEGSYSGVPCNFTAFEIDIVVLEREDWHQVINFGGYIVNFQSNTLNVTANSNIDRMWINGEPVVAGTPFVPIGERFIFRGQTKSGIDTSTTGTYIFSNSVSQFLKGRIYDVKMYQGSDGSVLALHYDASTGTMLDQTGNGRHAVLYGGTWGSDELSSVDHIASGSAESNHDAQSNAVIGRSSIGHSISEHESSSNGVRNVSITAHAGSTYDSSADGKRGLSGIGTSESQSIANSVANRSLVTMDMISKNISLAECSTEVVYERSIPMVVTIERSRMYKMIITRREKYDLKW